MAEKPAIQEYIENTIYVTNLTNQQVKLLIEWGRVKFWSRMLILTGVGIIFIGIYFFASNEALNFSKEKAEGKITKQQEILKINRLKDAFDSIELCITSIEKKSDLEKRYCEIATNSYKTIAEKNSPPDQIKTIVDLKAYGEMKIDTLRFLRHMELEKLNNEPHTIGDKLAEFFLSQLAFVCFSVIFIGIYAGFVYALNHEKNELKKLDTM